MNLAATGDVIKVAQGVYTYNPLQDQSSASRDPEGPQPFPDEPSLSTVPPGENGDGRKPLRDALAGKGTEGNPADQLSKPQMAVMPPPSEASPALLNKQSTRPKRSTACLIMAATSCSR